MATSANSSLEVAAQGDEARPVEIAPFILADDVDHVSGQADVERRRGDLPDVPAQPDPATAIELVDVQGVIGADGEDLRTAGGGEAGADLCT